MLKPLHPQGFSMLFFSSFLMIPSGDSVTVFSFFSTVPSRLIFFALRMGNSAVTARRQKCESHSRRRRQQGDPRCFHGLSFQCCRCFPAATFHKNGFCLWKASLDRALEAATNAASDLVILHISKADAAIMFADAESAAQNLKEARMLFSKTLPPEHPFAVNLAFHEGVLSLLRGDRDSAQKHIGEAERIAETLNLTKRPVFAFVLRARGVMRLNSALFTAAAEDFRQSSAIFEQTGAGESWVVDQNRIFEGAAYGGAGDLSRGELPARRALENLIRKLSASHIVVLSVRPIYARLLQSGGRMEEALEQMEVGITATIANAGKTNATVARAYHGLGALQLQTGRHSEALYSFDQALGIDWRVVGAESPAVALDLNGIGLAKLASGQASDAVKTFTTSAEILMSLLGTNDLTFATVFQNLGVAHLRSGQLPHARGALLYAMNVWLRNTEEHPSINLAFEHLGIVELVSGNRELAANMSGQVLPGRENGWSGRSLGSLKTMRSSQLEMRFAWSNFTKPS